MTTTRTSLLLLGLLAALFWSGPTAGDDPKNNAPAKKHRGKFTIDKDTTYVTGPLDKDGYVDYASALNERLGKGVTPANNANVLLWKALGPNPEGATMPAEFFQLLGIEPPPDKGDYFIDLSDYLKEQFKIDPAEEGEEIQELLPRAMQRPWMPKDYPKLAAWLKANEKPPVRRSASAASGAIHLFGGWGMKRYWVVLQFGLAVTLCASPSMADDKQGSVVDFDGLKSAVPANWKEDEPTNKLRYKQFRLPKTGDDKADAELVIFRGLGGSAKENIDRWKGQFLPPAGKKLEDVAKVTELKVSGARLSYLDIRGIYLFKARPFDPNEKAERRPDYRMLAVHFQGPKTVYHIRLVGPAKTVEQYKKGFDDWLKAFK